MLVVGLCAFTYETVEHGPRGSLLADTEYVEEIFLHAILFPLLGLLLLFLQQKLMDERRNTNLRLTRQIAISQDLSRIDHWDGLIFQVTHILQSVAPVQDLRLWVREFPLRQSYPGEELVQPGTGQFRRFSSAGCDLLFSVG